MAPRKAIAPTRKANKLEAAGVRGKAKASTRKTPAQQSKPATTKPTQGKAAPSIANEKALIDTNQHFNDSTNVIPEKTARTSAPKRKRDESKEEVHEKNEATATIKQRKSKRDVEKAVDVHVSKRAKLSRGRTINQAPTEKLNVYVCGEVSAGELGLGPKVRKVMRPRLNTHLLPDSIGVVQVATGGMHALALTHDNKIYSWGVNDNGALGRDTSYDAKMVDIDDTDDDDDDDDVSDMNPLESTPAAIDAKHFPENTVFTQIAAGDSASFALTDDGRVYGWGTFRSNDGENSFIIDKQGKMIGRQRTPVLLPTLKGITQIACGADHALALNSSGHVYAWGNGQQNQLGRRIVERTKTQTVMPSRVSLPRKKIIALGCGSYHSFAIDSHGGLWAWGLNSYGEAGIPIGNDEEVSHFVTLPQKVKSIEEKDMKAVQGGSHHSVGVTTSGECLVWGRVDVGQCGVDVKTLPEEAVIKDIRGNPRILSIPTAVPSINAVTAAAGSDHTIAITKDGKAYSWGFNETYQTGQGKGYSTEQDTDQGDGSNSPTDILLATIVDNTALRNMKVNWAGAGGQYSIITAPVDEKSAVNGTI